MKPNRCMFAIFTVIGITLIVSSVSLFNERDSQSCVSHEVTQVDHSSYNGFVWLTPSKVLFLPRAPHRSLVAMIQDINDKSTVSEDLDRDASTLSIVVARLSQHARLTKQYLDVDPSERVVATAVRGSTFPPPPSVLVAMSRSANCSKIAYVVKSTRHHRWKELLKRILPLIDAAPTSSAYLWIGRSTAAQPNRVGLLIDAVSSRDAVELRDLQWTPGDDSISYYYAGKIYTAPIK